MEVDPPAAANISSTPIYCHRIAPYCSRDLESITNGSTETTGSGMLKRSNSAPMINVLVANANIETSPPVNSMIHVDVESTRIRRYSSSSTTLHSTTPIKPADRVHRLKAEEIHIADRETQREREVAYSSKISKSWNEFSLDEPMISSDSLPRSLRPRSFSESLHIFTSPSILCIESALSPNRTGKQCFSPSMQAPVKNNSFSPSPSPSPTRKSFVRSLSPIISVRPSPLGKRKLEPDGDGRLEYMSPPKKFHTGPSTPDRMIPHPLAHSSVSSSSLEETSPDQPTNSNSSLQDVRTSSRPQPHMFGFMPLHDSTDMQTTDSETSDVTESTDMSESGDNLVGMLHSSGSPATASFTPVKPSHL